MHTLKVFFKLCDLNFKHMLMYRASFFISLILMTFWTAAFVILISVIFLHTDSLAGFNKGQVLFVLAFYYLFQNFSDIFFKDNFELFGEAVNRGTLDFYLVKPVPARLLAFFKQMRFDHLAGLVITGFLFFYASKNLTQPVSALLFLKGVGYSILATMLYWNLLSIISTFSFWITKNDAFRGLIWNMTQVSRYPRQIYKNLLRKTFTFLIPLTVLASIPAEISLRLGDEPLEWYVIGLTAVFSIVSYLFWKAGLKRYTSAS